MKKIEFTDFSQSVSTEEFIGILELTQTIYENFEKDVERKNRKVEASEQELEEAEEALGKYHPEVRAKRKMFSLLDETLSKDLGKRYSKFVANYDGIIEFLIKFNLSGSIKKRDINKFKNKRDAKVVKKSSK